MDEKLIPEQNTPVGKSSAPEAAGEDFATARDGAPVPLQVEALLEQTETLPASPPVMTAVDITPPLAAAPPAASESPVAPVPVTPGIRLEKKHPLAIRWMHWINFPVLATMIWSGLLIYWGDSDISGANAHQVYRIGLGKWTLFRFFPDWFWAWYPISLNFLGNAWHGAAYNITMGLGYHFFFMWFFMLNGVAYVLYTLISGEWRYLVPTKDSFKEAIQVTLHDLGIRKEPLPHRKFNGAQQIAYTSVILMGLGSLVTGLAIYKPSQAHLITLSLGGYEVARWLHFWLTLGYCAFFLIHISQVAKAGWNNFRAMVSGYEIVPASEPVYKPER